MIGSLRAKLGVYVPQKQPDAFGGVSTSWVFFACSWADIQPLAPRERVQNDRLMVIQSYRVIIRFRDDFPKQARLVWGTRTLRFVTASDPDNRREKLHLICEEEQP